MTAYYNENDPYAAAWLRNLIAAGHIAPGEVDDRSIADVTSAELAAFDQCHFFAGIGGWSLALRLAGWPDDQPVWTGSCPCQPFSAAGKGLAFDDPRHLWPTWFRLIAQCRPDVVFGEQVESAVRHGWLDGVYADLEGEGYAVGATVLGAHSVGAPHIRQRLWWVADADHGRHDGSGACSAGRHESAHDCDLSRLADPDHAGRSEQRRGELLDGERPASGHDGDGRPLASGSIAETGGLGSWSNYVWIPCADGKARRIEPGLEPLAHGVFNRVGRLRAYGNAICPEVAAEFITAFREAQP